MFLIQILVVTMVLLVNFQVIIINMGLVPPPQQKGRLPLSSRNMSVDLQQNFDEVKNCDVFKCPDDAGKEVLGRF